MYCKFCQSPHVVKYGFRNNEVHYYRCKQCGRKFSGAMAPENMHFSKKIISESIGLFYYGMPLRDISRHLLISDGIYVAPSSIWRWIMRFSGKAEQILDHINIGQSQRWLICENQFKVTGHNWFLIDVIDYSTRFLLSSIATEKLDYNSILLLFKKANYRITGIPNQVVTNPHTIYSEIVEHIFGANTEHHKHIKGKGIRSDTDTHLMRLFQRMTRNRSEILSRLKTTQSMEVITQGFIIHYNFMSFIKELGEVTPAAKAGLNCLLDNWSKVIDYK